MLKINRLDGTAEVLTQVRYNEERVWSPISRARPAWDILFIVDFTFAAILLVPQFAAWIHRTQLLRQDLFIPGCRSC